MRNVFLKNRITVMGLGVLGRGVGDVKWLAEHGADLTVTDLKKKEDLAPSLKILEQFVTDHKLSPINFVLGEHRLEDFRGRDFILKSAGVPLDSPYIAEARKNGVPVEMSASLVAKLSPATIVGVTGTRGKTTTTHMIYEILKAAGKTVHFGGNIQGVANLPLLDIAKEGDYIVMELDSWQLQGFGESRISPHLSVFTILLPDHLNYYKGSMDAYFDDKANIFKYQKTEDILILGSKVASEVRQKYGSDIKGRVIVADPSCKPDIELKVPGDHNRYNAAMAYEAGIALGVPEDVVIHALEEFKGVSGRLEFVKEIGGVRIYNDTTSTTPDAAVAALEALGDPVKKNIVLIMGGADKTLDMSKLVEAIPRFCKAVVLLPGTGTDKLLNNELRIMNDGIEIMIHDSKFMIQGVLAKSLREAVEKSKGYAESGDAIVFSPAFASFGLFKNEYDRGEQFMALVKEL